MISATCPFQTIEIREGRRQQTFGTEVIVFQKLKVGRSLRLHHRRREGRRRQTLFLLLSNQTEDGEKEREAVGNHILFFFSDKVGAEPEEQQLEAELTEEVFASGSRRGYCSFSPTFSWPNQEEVAVWGWDYINRLLHFFNKNQCKLEGESSGSKTKIRQGCSLVQRRERDNGLTVGCANSSLKAELQKEGIMGEDVGKEPSDYSRRAQIFDKSSRVIQALRQHDSSSVSPQHSSK